jgi:hypothetical protein
MQVNSGDIYSWAIGAGENTVVFGPMALRGHHEFIAADGNIFRFTVIADFFEPTNVSFGDVGVTNANRMINL